MQDSDKATARSIEWLERLVRIDTTSRNSNLGLIEEVRDFLRRYGFAFELTYDRSGRKANLFATLADVYGGLSGGLLLSGHSDVVPVDGQSWDSDPFELTRRDERLYGRGACDMKGFIASVLALVERVPAEGLRSPLHIALSYDEEIGCRGAPAMIEAFTRRGVRPDGCLIGEPSDMTPVIAHKGINIYRCAVIGVAAHSSLTTHGVNAAEYAARLIVFIHDIANQFAISGPRDDQFDVPFTTAATCMVNGGIAVNSLPALCEFSFEYRNLPEVDPVPILLTIQRHVREVLLPEMRLTSRDCDIEFEEIACAPAFHGSVDALVTRWVLALTKAALFRKVAYGSEAGQFQEAGVPTIICGPGSIDQAHRANEFVTVDQMRKCNVLLQGLLTCLAEDEP
ncbi:MAG TPA: acetylornithine deacetylase [Steroidobacteraceae bacterium]|nr:acetylornithine deacetylase [Steroidobacteraceae bacterium]